MVINDTDGKNLKQTCALVENLDKESSKLKQIATAIVNLNGKIFTYTFIAKW